MFHEVKTRLLGLGLQGSEDFLFHVPFFEDGDDRSGAESSADHSSENARRFFLRWRLLQAFTRYERARQLTSLVSA